MSVNLESVLKTIQIEKDNNLKPENIRYGTSCLGVKGTLKPVTLNGGDTATSIYLQNETPVDPNGIWLNTDKQYEQIYVETSKYTNAYSFVYSDDVSDSDNNTNPIYGITLPKRFFKCTTCQRGNIIHYFGYLRFDGNNSTYDESYNPTSDTLVHYMYNYDTNTWTRLADCPTPQGGGYAVWVNDYIYIFGTVHTNYTKYVYKYDTINDIWERMTDLLVENNYMVSGCFDGNETVYYVRTNEIYSYNINTGEQLFVTITKNVSDSGSLTDNSYRNLAYQSRHGLCYDTGFIYCVCSGTNNYGIAKYDIANNKWSAHCYSVQPYVSGVYAFIGENNGNLYFGYNFNANNLSNYTFYFEAIRKISISDKNYKNLTSSNSYSQKEGYIGDTAAVLSTIAGDVLCLSGSYTTPMTGVILEEKEYDFDKNTLVLYTADGGHGDYETELFKTNKVQNAFKFKTGFNNVNFYDAESKTLIKNIPTSYGNGTDWIKIK